MLQARRGSSCAQPGRAGHDHGAAGARSGAPPVWRCWQRAPWSTLCYLAYTGQKGRPGIDFALYRHLLPAAKPWCTAQHLLAEQAARLQQWSPSLNQQLLSSPALLQEVMDYASEEEQGGDPPRIWAPGANFPGTAFTRSLGDSGALCHTGLCHCNLGGASSAARGPASQAWQCLA